MEKKYDDSEIIKIVDEAFDRFEKTILEGNEKQGKDSQFGIMVTMTKFAIISEIMSIIKGEE